VNVPEFFHECSNQVQQEIWLRSHMSPCPFCGGSSEHELLVYPPSGGTHGYFELGCRGAFYCIGPRSVDKDGLTALRRWNMRGGKEK
jgi:hypothetical protein